jgi:hypothetical protein
VYASGYPAGSLDPRTPFVEKPFTPESLALAVRQALDHAAPAEARGYSESLRE